MKKLSIIIPAYNAERFIDKQLSELVYQTDGIQNYCEIIVVNDGSKDNTAEIAESYAKNYNFIRLISQENKGECGARNTGIKNAIGEYVYFLDADDFLEPESIKYFISQIDAHNKENIELFCYSYKSIDYDTNRLLSDYSLKYFNNVFLTGKEYFDFYLNKKIYSHVCSSVMKKSILIENSVYFTEGVKIGGDILFQLQLFNCINKVYCTDRHCFIYRIRNDSIMQGYKTYQKAQFYSIELIKNLLNSYAYEAPQKYYVNFYVAVHYIYNLKNYLKSDTKDKEINQMFLNNSYLIRTKLKTTNKKFLLIILLFRLFSVKRALNQYKKFSFEG